MPRRLAAKKTTPKSKKSKKVEEEFEDIPNGQSLLDNEAACSDDSDGGEEGENETVAFNQLISDFIDDGEEEEQEEAPKKKKAKFLFDSDEEEESQGRKQEKNSVNASKKSGSQKQKVGAVAKDLSPPPLKANKQSLAEYTAYLERKLKMAKKASKRNPDPVESDEVEDPEPEDQDQDEGIDGGEITAEEEKEKKEAKKMAKKNCQFDNFSLPSVVENDLVSNSTTFIPKYKALGGARVVSCSYIEGRNPKSKEFYSYAAVVFTVRGDGVERKDFHMKIPFKECTKIISALTEFVELNPTFK